ncbi:4-alpha-glucanotransferase [Pseudactinotalea sp. Z1732]|uniref:4-alpha-glucanotransferase n=1 Tax=Pseudactinotalea sp. Z1732 TaxID=3413026 RepID=UPI003C79C9F2
MDEAQVDPTAPDESLRALAQAHGVAVQFWDFHGNRRDVTAATIREVLTALDVAAETPEQVQQALEAHRLAPWRQVLPPSIVTAAGQEREFAVHVRHGAAVAVHVDLEDDGGNRELAQIDKWVEPEHVDGVLTGQATFVLPGDLPLGWHRIVAEVDDGTRAECVLAVSPARLQSPPLRPAFADRAWGLMAQLYSVRSERSWGVGDFADLAELGSLGAELGADFVLVNPLHAAEPSTPLTPSPYLPTTRRFINPIYIRPEDIREAAYLPNAQRTLLEWGLEAVSEQNTDPGPIDRDAMWQAKKPALETIYAAGRSRSRQRDLEAFRREQGQGLEDFALWSAVKESYTGADWPLDDAITRAGLARLRRELAERIDFHVWLQWVADAQLSRAQAVAKARGMSIGIMHDLAVGVHPEGADSWSLRGALASGISVGAPPDMYNQQGQDWSQPPLRPDRLAQQGYAPVRDMIRTVLRHAGALRVDHIIGMFRLWWIPAGQPPGAGTYVTYDHEAMVGVLALEAHRAGALVIGEDLGTVEPWVRTYLTERGILGTSVLWFEREADGAPLAPERYRRLVLGTVTTHDLPPTAGYLAEEHVDLRESLDLLTEPVEQVRLAARAERAQMDQALVERGLLPDYPTERERVEALHRYVASSPAMLVGVSLADAVGERRAQNQPGTDTEYPNWKIPLADGAGRCVLVEDLPGNARFASLVSALDEQLREPTGPA